MYRPLPSQSPTSVLCVSSRGKVRRAYFNPWSGTWYHGRSRRATCVRTDFGCLTLALAQKVVRPERPLASSVCINMYRGRPVQLVAQPLPLRLIHTMHCVYRHRTAAGVASDLHVSLSTARNYIHDLSVRDLNFASEWVLPVLPRRTWERIVQLDRVRHPMLGGPLRLIVETCCECTDDEAYAAVRVARSCLRALRARLDVELVENTP